MNNLTAGTGDPYWYEWSVGLLYMVKLCEKGLGIFDDCRRKDGKRC